MLLLEIFFATIPVNVTHFNPLNRAAKIFFFPTSKYLGLCAK